MTGTTYKPHWIYDLETYPNVFTFSAVYSSGQGLRCFEISDRMDDTEEIMEFLRNLVRHGHSMVGFNNIGFDYVIVHYMLQKARVALKQETAVKFTANELYGVAMDVIESMKGNDRFGKTVKESEWIIPQIDLFKIWHFDNKAKSTSLKILEFNMRSDNIEDLPFPVGTVLTSPQIDELKRYNKHDVMETFKFYKYSQEALQLREELTKLYGFDCTNFNDTKIGKELFIRSIEAEAPGSCYSYGKNGHRKIRQTRREIIHLRECLFAYIKFDRPEFNAILEWFKKQSITETNGVFSDLLESEVGDVSKYAEMVVKKIKISDPANKGNKRYVPSEEVIQQFKEKYPLGWLEEKELKSPKGAKSYYWNYRVVETMNVVIDGFRYDYGLGGIHGAKQGVVEPKEGEVLMSYDVASYYPNMAISNKVHPEHLGMTFCKVFKDLYEKRKSYPKGSAPNAALKLALNGSWGDSGNEFSPMYDPKYTMMITIGGQMSLCMLIEDVINQASARIIMCNTDGFEFIVKEDQVSKVKGLVKKWETTTGLEMEGTTYSKMWIANVNNYISLSPDGKVKLKGAFEHMDFTKLGWSKNHSCMVVPKAVEKYFVYGEDYEEFIRLHRDKFDFMLRTKVPRSSKLMIEDELGNREQVQNNCRYFPVKKNGGKLIKVMPEIKEGAGLREIGIDTDWNVKIANNIKEFSWSELDYGYYIAAARKLINSVVGAEEVSSGELDLD